MFVSTRSRIENFDALMARRRDKVQETVDSVVTEARIALNATLFGKNIFALSFEVIDDLLEAEGGSKVSENQAAKQCAD